MKTILITILLCFTGCSLVAQVNLRISDQGIMDLAPYLEEGEEDSIAFYLKNTGNATFSGSIYTHQRVNGVVGGDLDTINVPVLNPGDSALVSIEDYEIDPVEFDLGRNTIVIWVTDDNFQYTSNEDTNSVFIYDGPAFRFGNSGVVGFPVSPDTGQTYSFDIHVLNESPDDYSGRLFTRFAVNGDTGTVVSDSIFLPGKSSIFLPVDYAFAIPPYTAMNNLLKMWVDGSGMALAIDTAYYQIDFRSLDVEEEALEKLVSVFPNPASEALTIVADPKTDLVLISLYDLQGRLVQTRQSGRLGGTLPGLQDLPRGIYTLRLQTRGGGALHRRVVLK